MKSFLVFLVVFHLCSGHINFDDVNQTNAEMGLNVTGLSPEIQEAVALGAKHAFKVCQHQFEYKKWNCPHIAFTDRNSSLLTKEASYIHTILAASLVNSITRHCSKSFSDECGCAEKNPDLPQTDNWTWGGCTDNVTFAENVVKSLLNITATDIKSKVILHNIQLGAEIFRNKLVRKCRCHGVSGSCMLQTCWLQIPRFHKVARDIKRFYKDARRVKNESDSAKNLSKKNKMFYLDKAPNYCKANENLNVLGTKGRQCFKNTPGVPKSAKTNSCRTLCTSCHYKIKTIKIIKKEKCMCSVTQCCQPVLVECKTCWKVETVHYCEWYSPKSVDSKAPYNAEERIISTKKRSRIKKIY